VDVVQGILQKAMTKNNEDIGMIDEEGNQSSVNENQEM